MGGVTNDKRLEEISIIKGVLKMYRNLEKIHDNNGNYYVDFYILGKLIFRKEIIFKNNSIYTNKIGKGV